MRGCTEYGYALCYSDVYGGLQDVGTQQTVLSTDDEAFLFYDFPNSSAKGICPSLGGMPNFGANLHRNCDLWIGYNRPIIRLFSRPSLNNMAGLYTLPFKGVDILQHLIPDAAPSSVVVYQVEKGRWWLSVNNGNTAFNLKDFRLQYAGYNFRTTLSCILSKTFLLTIVLTREDEI